ncbi:Uncharacterised protein [[Clostridium] sordellii]|uniref:hypothetical protein n=1 Tax=Paraclostridium sordellii TaxID=1505 RepID=UPI0005E8F822|nr:hypothetical protein [Paeniclostridium sordellii]CEO36669.1 Uncharacterised protein [[Clostridium] sordellii] [Paeniclostridium sordellii]
MKLKKVIFTLSLILASFVTAITAYAKEVKSTIPVTYTISEDSRYDLNIKVSGDGTVYDGSKRIRNGRVVHQLKVSEEKVLEIIPDEGIKLKSISWSNGEVDLSKYYEIEDVSRGKKLSLKGISTDSELEIQFDIKNNTSENLDQDQNKNDSDIKDDGEKSPQTGDNGMLGWIILFILSLAMILLYVNIDRRKSKVKK